jgi:hypothetical protein
MTTPKFFDPLKFMMNGLNVAENFEPDPDFDKKVAIMIQHEIKETTARLVLTSSHSVKKELTTRLEKLQKIYQGFITGDNISRIVKIVEEDKDAIQSLGMSESEKAALLEKVKSKIQAIGQKGDVIDA